MILKIKNFEYKNKYNLFIFMLFFAINAAYYHYNRYNFRELAILEPVPSQNEINFYSFGDTQSYFRVLALQLQFMGDTYGRSTPLKNYDYRQVYQWMKTLDSLDKNSNYVPSLAAYYYSMTPKNEDIKYMIDYLLEHSLEKIDSKWWWVYQASYLAFHKLDDKEYGAKIATNLINTKAEVPMWVRQLPAIYYEKLGNKQESYKIIKSIVDNVENIPENDLNYIHYFLKERLKVIEGKEQ